MSFDKILALVPILAVALAVTFDAGYFWGVDINFFTLFSLSEHLVFAIEAIPYVFGIMFICSLFLPLFVWIMRDTEPKTDKLPRRQKWALIVILALHALIFAFVVWQRDYVLIAIDLGLSAVILAVFLARHLLLPTYRRELFLGYWVASSFIISFVIGYNIGDEYLHETEFHPHSIHLKDSTTIVGRIVRSGDRGILFVESKRNSLQFIRLEQMISISRD
jgi:hypothetical protein